MDHEMIYAYFRQLWNAFETYIDRIYNVEYQTPAELMEARKFLGDTINSAPKLGAQFYKAVYCYIAIRCTNIVAGAKDKSGDEFLEYYRTQWEDFRMAESRIDLICFFLNCCWIVKRYKLQMATMNERNVYPIGQLSLIIWKKMVYYRLPLNLTNVLIDKIRQERSGVAIDTKLMFDILSSYIELGFEEQQGRLHLKLSMNFYNDEFEKAFLLDTAAFYEAELSGYMRKNDRHGFIIKSEQREFEERRRNEAYLHRQSFLEVMAKLESLRILE